MGAKIIIIIFCVFFFELIFASRLCCTFGFRYQSINGTCDRNPYNVSSIRNVPLFKGEALVGSVDSKKLSVIDKFWCASNNDSKWYYPIEGDGLLQTDSRLFAPEENTYFEEEDYCLLWTALEVGYIPVLCGNVNELDLVVKHSTTYGKFIIKINYYTFAL